MWTTINAFLKTVDNFVWGVPLMVLILCGGILLTVRSNNPYQTTSSSQTSVSTQVDDQK